MSERDIEPVEHENTQVTSNNLYETQHSTLSSTFNQFKTFLGFSHQNEHNWKQREYRILNYNHIFGGKFQKDNINDYLNKLKNENNDADNPLLMYEKFHNTDTLKLSKQNKSVVNIAIEKVEHLIGKDKVKKEENDYQVTDGHELRPMLRGNVVRNEPYRTSEVMIKYENKAGPCDAFSCNPGAPGNLFCDKLCDNYTNNSDDNELKEMLSLVKEHRPYFTYWVTTVQIVICIFSLISYKMAPFGFSYSVENNLVTSINLEKAYIEFEVKQNFWLGPGVADLIHLGAKYAPCMRNDTNIYKAIESDRQLERQTACCVRKDRGGCVQVGEKECLNLYSTWNKLNNTDGTVCGLDSEYCADEFRLATWSQNDLTTWPICNKYSKEVPRIPETSHLTCDLIGRPCCVGVQGECMITTREDCDLRKGYFHDNAQLCSQVDCMQDICGMIDFFKYRKPDQIYRLFSSIFIHAGIIQLLLTILFQYFVMRDIEKIAGFIRIAFIYIFSGAIGNLASCIFLPYQAEVGPLGAQCGILACVYVEMIHVFKVYAKPCNVILKMCLVLLFVVILGLFPIIDNYQNIFGFLAGFCLSLILFPSIAFSGKFNRCVMFIIGCVSLAILVLMLIILFYIKPIDNCEWCKFLSCPFGPRFCLNMDFNITRIRFN